ncbi:uncharacterized protein LOC113219329 [Apis mellifera]|uniref:Uncharacterized protein LOC113219329 n=1 Tax=Apis mellifera TaxID=7460 RepID=A0A7M7MVQ5_APIME|nr:uncharacterized protein LOC113219329 [Apis mellifera]|eukprot:XP_026301711.1 uncharacterized protein LOC113219329 [Apis mellifera]
MSFQELKLRSVNNLTATPSYKRNNRKLCAINRATNLRVCEKSVCACVRACMRAHCSRALGTFQRDFRAELLAYLGIRLTDSKYSISVNGHKENKHRFVVPTTSRFPTNGLNTAQIIVSI